MLFLLALVFVGVATTIGVVMFGVAGGVVAFVLSALLCVQARQP